MLKKALLCLSKAAALILLCPTLALAISLTASVDRSTIDLEETLQLTLKLDTQANGKGPDFSALDMNFDIISNNRSSQYRSVNGKAESFTEWKLILSPKKVGQLLIPSVNYQGIYSEALVVEVKKTEPSNNSSKDIFIESSVSKSSVHVQEQIIFTVRLFTSINLRSINSDELVVDDALLVELSEQRYQKRLNDKPYAVIEIRYALFPQTSGVLEIPPLIYSVATKGRVRDPWSDPFGTQTGEMKRLRTQPLTVTVKPAEESFSGSSWLPSSQLSLSEEWSSDPSTFKVGEPITRVITLAAKGLTGAQLPPLKFAAEPGVKYYPDQAQTQDQNVEQGVTGLRTETIAVVPMKSGPLTLPAISLSWWNTDTQQQEKTTLPAITVDVAEAAGVDYAQALPTPIPQSPTEAEGNIKPNSTPPFLWMAISAALALLSFALLIAYWRLKNRINKGVIDSELEHQSSLRTEHEDEQKAFQAMKEACINGDLAATREKIIAWGVSRWPNKHSLNLASVGQHFDCEEADTLLQELDASIYRGTQNSESWPADKFLNLVKDLRSKKVTRRESGSKLRALYPTN